MCKLNLNVPTETLSSENDLAFRLAQEDPTPAGITETPHFLYRGQPSRYSRSWPPAPQNGIPLDAYADFDSIIPTDYRQFEAGIRGNVPEGMLRDRYGDPVANLRSFLTIYAARQRAQASLDVSLCRWVDDSLHHRTVPPTIHHLLSIGQHYGFRTHYLDATSAWSVAMVFATRQWSGSSAGTYLSPGEAVIYRIDHAILESVQQCFMANHPQIPCRAVDIRSTPLLLAPRAAGQHGWSIIGLESPYFLSDLINAGGVRAFRFQRTGPSSCNTDALFQQMQPSADPFLYYSEAYRTPGPWIQHVQAHFGSRFAPIDLNNHAWLTEIYA